MGQKFTNNAKTQTATTLNPGDTTVALPAGAGALFPPASIASGDYFMAVLVDTVGNLEIVKVTERVTDSLTIVRAQEGTTARYYPTGSIFSHRVTAATYASIVDRLLKDGSEPMTGTASLRLPAGTTAQRPAAGAAQKAGIRLNTSTNKFEGTSDGTVWGPLGGGAAGGGGDEIFLLNDQTVTQDYTIPATKNALSAGPITIADGVTVTISSGSVWTII